MIMIIMMMMTPGSSSVFIFIQNIIIKDEKGAKTGREDLYVSNKKVTAME
jgi:hypothetical protein